MVIASDKLLAGGASDNRLRASGEVGPVIEREGNIAGTVVFVNGFPGCGKSMLTPIVGSMNRVELVKYDYYLENLVELFYLNVVREDACASLIKTWTDLDLYNLAMGRETNFRYSDVSGIFMNRRAFQYITRIFGQGDAAAVEHIKKEKPILLLETHMLVLGGRVLFRALEERLRFIEVVRHPLYMIKQVRVWMPRADGDPRFFFQRIKHNDTNIPWFAHGWEEVYSHSNMMDRVIHMIEFYYRRLKTFTEQLEERERSRFMIVPFERFVTEPSSFVGKLESMLGTRAGKAAKRMMKRQNVPRKMWADGINLKIYKHYGWRRPEAGATEADEMATRRACVAEEASDEAMKVLDRLSRDYEESYLVS